MRGGSSPPARGTHLEMARPGRRGRFIPACAGNTGLGAARAKLSPVHPRLRGEHPSRRSSRQSRSGSSPPARGTLRRPERGQIFRSVHPRLRGEHRVEQEAGRAGLGSSPPARGTPGGWVVVGDPWRFIPACAGNTKARGIPQSIRSVHPRLRGEHALAVESVADETGSSPPARGTPATRRSSRFTRRFIPACAGNTAAAGSAVLPGSVHPRLRGEHAVWFGTSASSSGSSPPARGTLLSDGMIRGTIRFIPACAGNTHGSRQVDALSPVHPRLRGEHGADRAHRS